MNSKQRRRFERVEKKYSNELFELLVQLRNELVENKITKQELINMVNEMIEFR